MMIPSPNIYSLDIQFFAKIPDSVTELSLSWNDLGEKTDTELALVFSGIPGSIRSLNLTGNRLDMKTGSELALIFAEIPDSVTELNLTWTSIGLRAGTELAQAFGALPATLRSLDLSWNYLDEKTGTELAQTFRAIPGGINTLNLSNNNFGKKERVELVQAFKTIPSSVTSLDLSNNQLQELSVATLQIFPKVETIYLSEGEIRAMDKEQRTALVGLFPNIKNIILLDKNNNPLGGENLEACHFFADQLGLTRKLPSLRASAAFFIMGRPTLRAKTGRLPQGLKDYVQDFNVPLS